MATVRDPSPAEGMSVSQDPAGPVAIAEREPGPPASPPGAADLPAPVPPKPLITQEMIDKRFDKLLLQVQANRPSEDTSLIRKAWDFCVQHHAGQMRAS